MNNLIRRASVTLSALVSLLIFSWPLLISAPAQNEAALAQAVFIALMPMILVLALIEVSSGGIDSRQLALLGVLIALNACIRLLGAGTAGIETSFFLIIIGAYVFGAGFGFILGTCSLLVSALLTGGVGPWLPFQMMAAGLVGIGAGYLPRLRDKKLKLTLLVSYGIIASFIYGALMTLWNWPFLAGVGTDISYVAGAGLLENLTRFIEYEILTGGLLWDAGRALTTSVLIALTGTALLTTLNRAASRAGLKNLN